MTWDNEYQHAHDQKNEIWERLAREAVDVPVLFEAGPVGGFSCRISGDLVIWREGAEPKGSRPPQGVRGEVRDFSPSSRASMRRYLREACVRYRTMLTITYPAIWPKDGRVVKEHLRRFLQELKRAHEREWGGKDPSYSVFWFLEFQDRGAPHFHMFSTSRYDIKFVSKTWSRIALSGDWLLEHEESLRGTWPEILRQHLSAGTRVESLRAGHKGAAAYAMKYAAKSQQKEVPEGYTNPGRFWGVMGCRVVAAATARVSSGVLDRHESVSRKVQNITRILNKFHVKPERREVNGWSALEYPLITELKNEPYWASGRDLELIGERFGYRVAVIKNAATRYRLWWLIEDLDLWSKTAQELDYIRNSALTNANSMHLSAESDEASEIPTL